MVNSRLRTPRTVLALIRVYTPRVRLHCELIKNAQNPKAVAIHAAVMDDVNPLNMVLNRCGVWNGCSSSFFSIALDSAKSVLLPQEVWPLSVDTGQHTDKQGMKHAITHIRAPYRQNGFPQKVSPFVYQRQI